MEKEKLNIYQDQRVKKCFLKVVKEKDDSHTSHSLSLWRNPERPGKESRGIGNPIKDWDYLDRSTAEMGSNTEKSPGELRTHDVI